LKRPKYLIQTGDRALLCELASRIEVLAGTSRHRQQCTPDAALIHRLPRDT
jgi:hypothetical protein